MELTIEQALQQGVAAHKEGKLQDAERLYRAILQSQPAHPDANHHLGVMAVSVNKAEAALPLFKTALEANPKIEQFWLSYIDALIKTEKFENAKQAIEQAKKQGKLSGVAAHLLDAAIKVNMGSLDEAKVIYAKVIALKPDNVLAHNKLGAVLHELGKLDEAAESYKQAIGLNPDYAEAHFNLGNTLHKLGRLEEAEASYRQAIVLTTGFKVAHQKLALTQRELGKIEQAIQSERYAKFLNSSNVEAKESENFPDNLSFRQPSPVEYPALYRAGMGTENVGGLLRAMAQMLRPKNILEIGAGYTTPFLLEALINNERVYDDGNLDPLYFKDYVYDSKLVVIDNMSLGELRKKPGMKQIISSKYIEFVEGNFEGKAGMLAEKYGDFDFVWYDCGGSAEYKVFMDEYWDICSDYIFFHFTYSSGSPNQLRDIILNNVTGNPSIFDIVEPHKSRQGSITMVRKS